MAEKLDDGLDAFGAAMDRLAPDNAGGREALETALAEAQSRLPWSRMHRALLERVEMLDTARDRLALVLHATDPDVAGAARGKGDMAGVFEVLVAAADAAGLDAFLARAHELLENLPAARGDMPTVKRLVEIATQIEKEHEGTADALVSLAQHVEDLDEAERAAAPDAGPGPEAEAGD